MKTFAVGFITLCCVLVTACGGGSDHQDAPPINYTPELRAFDMLDSYDVDTAFSEGQTHLRSVKMTELVHREDGSIETISAFK